jgi:hypothetical protein
MRLEVVQLVVKFLTSYETWSFITVSSGPWSPTLFLKGSFYLILLSLHTFSKWSSFRCMNQNICITYNSDVCGTHPSLSPWFEYLESVYVVMLGKGEALPVHTFVTYRSSGAIAWKGNHTITMQIFILTNNALGSRWQKQKTLFIV